MFLNHWFYDLFRAPGFPFQRNFVSEPGHESIDGPSHFLTPFIHCHQNFACIYWGWKTWSTLFFQIPLDVEHAKCSICLNIWHDVVTVSPCLHNFWYFVIDFFFFCKTAYFPFFIASCIPNMLTDSCPELCVYLSFFIYIAMAASQSGWEGPRKRTRMLSAHNVGLLYDLSVETIFSEILKRYYLFFLCSYPEKWI